MSEEARKLYRSTSDRMLAGVAGGLGEYIGVDPTVVRLLFAFSTLWGGLGLFVYIVMMMIVPEAPAAASNPSEKKKEGNA